MTARPDQYSHAWYQDQFRELLKSNAGIKHATHLALAEFEAIKEIRARCEQLEKDREADRAKIGEQQALIEALTARMDKMREWAKKKASVEKEAA